MDRLSILNKCTQSGHQLTPQRQIIIDEFIKKDSGLSAYELLEIINLNDKSLNISTIYRILEFWVKLGVLHKVESNSTYVLCNDEHENHNHVLLLCTECNKINESCSISREFLSKSFPNFHIKSNQVIELKGICSDCT